MATLSALSKGYGSWTAGQVDPYFGEKYVADSVLPDIDPSSHRHGVSMAARSGRSTAMSWAGTRPVSRQHTEGSIHLPKTYSTRKGALQLFVGPEYEDEPREENRLPLRPMYSQLQKHFTKQELMDLSMKLGTLERLTKSVLQFGDEDYDHERTSVSDEKNKAFLKFLHTLDRCDTDLDEHVQPGGDLTSYLRDLKSSASQRYYSDGTTYLPKSRESQELQAILRGLDNNWPLAFKQDSFSSDVQSSGQFTRPVSRGPSPGPPSTPRSTYQVLSSRKVAASIKSGSYLGRPASTVSDYERDDSLADFDFLPMGDAHRSLSSAEFLNPDDLITGRSRRGLGYRSLTGSSIGEETEDDIASSYFEFGKRKNVSKKPELSKQGRHAHKGEGHHIEVKVKGEGHHIEVKVKGKGDGVDGESQVMDSIVEESSEKAEPEMDESGEVADDETESVDWEAKVAEAEEQRGKLLSGRSSIEPNLIKSSDSNEVNIDDIKLQTDNFVREDIVRSGSAQSSRSSASSRSSKRSPREMRALSIISVQEYDASRPSSSSGTLTFTPTSKHSLKRSTPSDKRSNSHVRSDSRTTSLTGSEVKTKDDTISLVNEINEIQGETINEEIITERDTDFITQGQIHVDIGYGSNEADEIAQQDLNEKQSDTEDNIGFEEAVDTQVRLDDQKSYFTESEDETEWAGKDKVEKEAENEPATEALVTEDAQKPKSPDVLSQKAESETEDKEVEDSHTEISVEVSVTKSVEPASNDTVDNEIMDNTDSVKEEIDTVKQDSIVGKVEEGSILDDSASNLGKSTDKEEIDYGAGLQALGPLLSDAFSDKGDKTEKPAETGKLSRPSSSKLSTSGKLSRPSSGKSRPSSGKLSRPASGKQSRPLSARTTPDLKEAKKKTESGSPKIDEKVEIQIHVDKKTDDVSKEIDTKVPELRTVKEKDEADKIEPKQETDNAPLSTKPGRQKGIKMKKPPTQRQRPGAKNVNSIKTDKPPIIGGYIPQQEDKKTTESVQETEVKSEHKDVVIPDVTIEGELSKIEEDPLKIEGSTEETLETSGPDKDASAIISELDKLGLRAPTKHKKKVAKEKEKVTIPSHLEEALGREPTRSYEALEADLEKMTDLVDESLSGPTLAAVGEGLTEEELELAKQILEKKMQDARDKLEGPQEKKPVKQKKVTVKSPKKGKGKRSETPVDTRTDVEKEQDEIKERQRQEKLRRDQEAKELQRKIAERKLLLKAQTDAQSARSKEIEAEMARFQQEADEIQQAEDQARDAMAELRKKQREERESRRKADLERKKAEAIMRREREKKQLEETKKKELEMLEKIKDADMRRQLREEQERKMYEEERLAQERLEEQLREAQRQAEEEEERMKELERQAEEEAMQRLIEEREAADRQRRRLQEEKEAMEEAERIKLEYLQQEELRLYEEKQKMEAEEAARREQERLRLLELRRLEEEARAKMQAELEKKRADALARRDFNIENRQNKDRLGHGQGITRAWTFSYFIKWPRESYEKSMGGINPKLKRFQPMRRKKPQSATAEAEKQPENVEPIT